MPFGPLVGYVVKEWVVPTVVTAAKVTLAKVLVDAWDENAKKAQSKQNSAKTEASRGKRR